MKKYIPILITVILFIGLCVSGSYWVMKLLKPDVRKVSIPQLVKPVPDVENVAGLFGGAMIVDTRYQLQGLIQANPMNQSVAIIAIDGKPTQAYSMEMKINPGSALSEVFASYVLVLDNGVSKRVELPLEPPAPIEIINPLLNNRQVAPLHDPNSGQLNLQHGTPVSQEERANLLKRLKVAPSNLPPPVGESSR